MFELRPYQESAVQVAVNWIKYKDENGIVVAPTGSGKSILISETCARLPDLRILVVAHRKELLEQNASKFSEDVSLFSAGLNSKCLENRVVVGGIQSLHPARETLPKFDLILIDECHRVPNHDEGQYWELIQALGNPQIVGFTATPHRLKGGKLDWAEVIYEIDYKILFDAGYLSPLTNKSSITPDLTGVQTQLGDYIINQLEEAMIEPELIFAAVERIKHYSIDRNSVLIFTVSVRHGELLRDALQYNGIYSQMVTGETPKDERAQLLDEFKGGHLQFLINCEILLEGFDAPNIDMIVCLRPTESKALWEQMIGRGVRVSEYKENCLLLDMAGNLKEHGGLGTPYKEKAKREKKVDAGKACPECESFVSPVAEVCPDCGFKFPEPEVQGADHNRTHDSESDAIYDPSRTTRVEYEVYDVHYKEHRSAAGNLTLRVDYLSTSAKYGSVSEWLSPFSDNDWASNNAWKFFKDRGNELRGTTHSFTMDELLLEAEKLRKPIKVIVDESEKYPRIKDYIYGEPKQIEVQIEVVTEDLLDDEIAW